MMISKQYEEDVIDKVRNNLSIGYKVLKSKIVNGVKEVTDFLIYETSIVPVPADPTATFRSDYQNQNLIYRNMNMEEKQTRSEKKASLKTESQIREELSQIINLGAKHNQSELASRHIENGSSIAEFRDDLLSAIATKPLYKRSTTYVARGSRNQEYSVAKSYYKVLMMFLQRGYEWEVSQDLERSTT